MGFWPLQSLPKNLGIHRDSNSQSGSSFGSVRVHSLTLFCISGSMKCHSWASLLARAFVSLCLGREPKARVVTLSISLFSFRFVISFALFYSVWKLPFIISYFIFHSFKPILFSPSIIITFIWIWLHFLHDTK